MTVNRLLAIVVLTGSSLPVFGQAPLRFAVIGDYGSDSTRQASIASRMASYNPSFVTTVGDNTYFLGTTAAEDFANWDKTQGKYYAQWIELPSVAKGSSANSAYGPGAAVNNFFPSIGNHDIDEGLTGYKDYFKNTPAGASVNYYKFTRGNVEVFMLSSDPREPDGRTAGTAQYTWAETNIRASTAAAQIVMYHHPAWQYPSGQTIETAMRWDYKGWGVDAVFTGHVHSLHAMDVNGLPYFVIGTSGRDVQGITGLPTGGATGLYANTSNFAFGLVDATDTNLTVQFIGEYGDVLYTQVIPVTEPEWYLLLSTIALAGYAAVRRPRGMAIPAKMCC